MKQKKDESKCVCISTCIFIFKKFRALNFLNVTIGSNTDKEIITLIMSN